MSIKDLPLKEVLKPEQIEFLENLQEEDARLLVADAVESRLRKIIGGSDYDPESGDNPG